MMHNPHQPEEVLWSAYSAWMDSYAKDRTNHAAYDTACGYYDQFVKVCEKRVVAELLTHKVKETAGDKKKIKPKADKLQS